MAAPEGVNIRTYRGGDESRIVSVWNDALLQDPIDMRMFARRVLCDANFSPQGLIIAEEDGEIIGFALAIERKIPLWGADLEPDQGWITAFAVHPARRRRGVGRALFEAAEAFLKQRGKKDVLISPYAPNYFWPGIDANAYPDGFSFLKDQGYVTLYTPISMDKNLVSYVYPADAQKTRADRLAEGYVIAPLTWSYLSELIAFANDKFNPDWGRAIREAVAHGMPLDQCFVAINPGGKLVGFALYGGYDGTMERFGPFGVDEEERGKGLGKVLLHETLRAMKSRGLHGAWFLWTGEKTAAGQLYLKAGFSISRTFHVMKKHLTEGA